MKEKFSLAACVLLLGVCPALRGQTNELSVGDSPPPLNFQSLLQAPDGAHPSWQTLKDKVVVLEFWATWCVPCIRAMPHLNEMADALKDAPVQFIAITDENAEIVNSFLKKRPIKAWIGLNTDKSMFAQYGVTSIPRSVVIDRSGKIAAITGPTDLTEQHLRDLIAGKPLTLRPQSRPGGFSFRPGELPEATGQGQPALFQLLIRPSETPNTGWGGSKGKFTFVGAGVMNMLCSAYDTDECRVITNCALPDGRFDAVVNVPANQGEAGLSWFRLALEGTFGLKVRRETRETEVLVMTLKNPKAEGLTETVSTGGCSSHSDPGQADCVNMPISSVAGTVQDFLKKPVLDETGLTNRYDWSLQWDAKSSQAHSTDALLRAVREQLGLELAPAKRPIEVIVVDQAG
jgi:uncharacterized protein (TIGR03435 family)